MKQFSKLFIAALLLGYGLFTTTSAQDFDPDEAYYGGGGFITLGNRPFILGAADLRLIYVEDDSGGDFWTEDVYLRNSRNSFSCKLGGYFDFGNNVLLKANGDFYTGQSSGASFEVGAGYNIGRNKLQVRPYTMFSFGASSIYIADLRNYSGVIDVNGKRFQSDSVAVRLRTRHIVLSPHLEVAYEIAPNIEVLAIGGYNVPLFKGEPFLLMAGESGDYSRMKAREKLSESNVGLYEDSEPLTTSPVRLNSYFIQVGIGFRL